MKLSMSKDEFNQIITDRLNLGPAILSGRVVTKVEFPSRFSADDDVQIEFGAPSERRIEEAPRAVLHPAHAPMSPEDKEPF